MKPLSTALCLANLLLSMSIASAQTPTESSDQKAQASSQRKAAGVEAARDFQPGEGNPKSEPKATSTAQEKSAARSARRSEGAVGTKSFKAGEGDPKPLPVTKVSRQDRGEARAKQRTATKAANKGGKIPNYGEGYGGDRK